MQTENINWNFTTKSILNQKTVVFVGHGLTINHQNEEAERSFFQEIAQGGSQDIPSFHAEDGFLIFANETAKLLYASEIRPFYERDFRNPILEKLAEIPFHLLITLTPDLTLNRIFEDKNFAYQHQYYKPKITQEIAQKPTAEKPLIYNLLGCVKDEESLITSHYDLFNYVESIYADKNLPEALTSVFSREQTTNIIFLGLDFDKWYFQLLLHLLKINFEPCVRYAAGQAQMNVPLQTLYESHFKINFVPNEIAQFVDQLHAQFQPGQLRQPAEAGATPKHYHKKQILKLLAKAFNATDFETFCFLNYEEVKDNFTPAQSQSARLGMLLEHVDRQQGYEELLALVREENPVQYKAYEPYYDAA